MAQLVKTMAGLAISGVKTVNGLAFASAKTIAGLDNTSGGGGETEFDIPGATYYAVAPAGYSYDGTQDANYSTRKYNTLFAAEAALSASPSTPQVINIIGDWSAGADTTLVNFDGTTPTGTNYTLVRAIGTARHAGVYSTAFYRLVNTANATAPLNLSDPFITIRGIQIVAGFTSGSQFGVSFASGALTDCLIDQCIVKRENTSGSSNVGVAHNTSSVTANVRNCLIDGFQQSGLRNAHASAGGFIAYNNTIVNCATGMSTTSSGNFLAINNIIQGSATATASGTFTTGTDYNYTSRATMGYSGGGANDQVSRTFTFINAGAGNYELDPADTSGALNSGQDLSGTFTRDITYETRAVPWSIGAFES